MVGRGIPLPGDPEPEAVDHGRCGAVGEGHVFQDPFASLNPRWTVNAIVSEPLRVHKLIKNESDRAERVQELLALVGYEYTRAEYNRSMMAGGYCTNGK